MSPSRSTRTRAAKSPLSEEAVVQAGLGVLRREGLAAVTMRRVAAELDTGPASLYVYVANRDELLKLMHDAVVGTVPLEPVDTERWRPQLLKMLNRLVRALAAHPGIARVSLGRIPTEPAWVRLFDHVLGTLLAGGIPRQNAAWGCDLLAMLTAAVAYETAAEDAPAAAGDPLQRSMDQRHAEAALEERLAALDADRHPYLAASATELAAGTAQERLDHALNTVIDGLLVTAAATPPAP